MCTTTQMPTPVHFVYFGEKSLSTPAKPKKVTPLPVAAPSIFRTDVTVEHMPPYVPGIAAVVIFCPGTPGLQPFG